jgi:hypothetical protein
MRSSKLRPRPFRNPEFASLDAVGLSSSKFQSRASQAGPTSLNSRNLALRLPTGHTCPMKKAVLLLLLTLPTVMWAKDGPGSAGKLEAACRSWAAWDAAGRPTALTLDAAKVAVDQARCIFFMAGWYAGVEGTLAPDDKGVVDVATFPEGVTTEQMAKVFVLYMAAHPAEENKLAHVALSDAMSDAGLLTWTVYKPGQ